VVSGASQTGPAIHLVVEDLETQVQIRSISPSGLAILDVQDPPPGRLGALLSQTMDVSNRVHLTASDAPEPIAVEVNLVWFEQGERNELGGSSIELIVDGSECPGWDQLLALSRL